MCFDLLQGLEDGKRSLTGEVIATPGMELSLRVAQHHGKQGRMMQGNAGLPVVSHLGSEHIYVRGGSFSMGPIKAEKKQNNACLWSYPNIAFTAKLHLSSQCGIKPFDC